MSTPKALFPSAQSAPKTQEEMALAIQKIQASRAINVPEVPALPTAPPPEMGRFPMCVLNNGTDPPTLHWWNGTAWTLVSVT